MNKKNFRPLFFGIAILIVILGIYSVWAYVTATSITFAGASSAYADSDGVFTINWTIDNDSELISPIGNWTVTLWMHEVLVSVIEDGVNTTLTNSTWGYPWSNDTEANYTFAFSAFLDNDTKTPNSTNVSMYVDGTAPIVNWTDSGYNNITPYKKNTDTLTVNVPVGDAASGLINSGCTFNISTVTNYTVMESGGWCNSTTINLTGLADGNHTIDIYVNDSANNVGVNLSSSAYPHYVVWIDSTNPVATTASCSPASITVGDTFPCSCSGSASDAGSGLNSTQTNSSTYGSVTDTSNTGTFTFTCTVFDNAGNSHSTTATYTIEQIGIPDAGIGITWATHTITEAQFENGYTSQIQANKRIRVQVGGEDHHVGIVSVTATEATIEIASDPVQVTLDVGEDAKVDVIDDGFYDIYVLLNAIVDSKADVTIQKIHEEIPEGEGPVATAGEIVEPGEGEEEEAERNLLWLWILIAVIVLVVIIGGGIALKKKGQ